ncbi:hypothetical protein TIFTF001_033532 [Ficus carica]|uniref:Uncharacterized protein n=1 Tax=Ficus carica TaxID=3494 RepID=A0AA88E0W0_FICCA|nr:hypothetical protein TIFTF001_033532 [Ficus carica]
MGKIWGEKVYMR